MPKYVFAGGAFRIIPDAASDTTPDAFEGLINDQFAAVVSTLYTSNSFTPVGYDSAASISVTGGEYSLDGGSWVSAPGSINPGQSVRLRGTSSGSASTTVNVALTIGGVVGTYSITTAAAGGAGIPRPGRMMGGMLMGR